MTTIENVSRVADAHESTDFPFAFKKLDWDEYHFYRPAYPQSMWDMWFSYHRSHNGEFNLAHDIGTGPGTAARVLVPHFAHLIVSDAGEANLLSSKTYLSPSSKLTFLHSPAEQLDARLTPQSVDFACVCMAFHYMHPVQTVSAISQTLRPGATFAAVTYGFRLRFPGNETLERLWLSITSGESKRLIRQGVLWEKVLVAIAHAETGLDFVGLPEDKLTDVRRVYVNCDGWQGEAAPFAFIEDEPGVVEKGASRVKDGEEVVRVRDEAWGREVDAAWLRGFLKSSQMGFGDGTWQLKEWMELERIIKEAGGKVRILWPVAMFLATKKRERGMRVNGI